MVMVILSDDLRHFYADALANRLLDQATDEEIIDLCPHDYGAAITDDHRLYFWDLCYDDYYGMEADQLWFSYQLHVIKRSPWQLLEHPIPGLRH